MHVYMCIMCMLGAHGSQRRVLDPLELKLQTMWVLGIELGEQQLLPTELALQCPFCLFFDNFIPDDNVFRSPSSPNLHGPPPP